MAAGIDRHYADRHGNPDRLRVVRVGINLQPGQEAQTDNFVRQAGFDVVLNDFDRTLANRFQRSGQPIFAIINGVANSPSHRPWELLLHLNGYGSVSHPIGQFRAAIDLVKAPQTPKVQVTGRVQYFSDRRAVPGVTMELSGDASRTLVCGNDGHFGFELEQNRSFVLRPNKTTDHSPSSGVTTLDIALLRRHVLGISNLETPHHVLAGDVNNSKSLTTLDISLMRRVILGLADSYPAGLWKFVRSDQEVRPDRILETAEPTRNLQNLTDHRAGLDFIAVKLGDVNGSWTPPSEADSE